MLSIALLIIRIIIILIRSITKSKISSNNQSRYHLKDHVRENIECVFYDAIDFFEEAKKEGGKVYVHCVQGVSRSATIVISYLMFTRKMTFHDAFSYVRERRGIINPNTGFIT